MSSLDDVGGAADILTTSKSVDIDIAPDTDKTDVSSRSYISGSEKPEMTVVKSLQLRARRPLRNLVYRRAWTLLPRRRHPSNDRTVEHCRHPPRNAWQKRSARREVKTRLRIIRNRMNRKICMILHCCVMCLATLLAFR